MMKLIVSRKTKIRWAKVKLKSRQCQTKRVRPFSKSPSRKSNVCTDSHSDQTRKWTKVFGRWQRSWLPCPSKSQIHSTLTLVKWYMSPLKTPQADNSLCDLASLEQRVNSSYTWPVANSSPLKKTIRRLTPISRKCFFIKRKTHLIPRQKLLRDFLAITFYCQSKQLQQVPRWKFMLRMGSSRFPREQVCRDLKTPPCKMSTRKQILKSPNSTLRPSVESQT